MSTPGSSTTASPEMSPRLSIKKSVSFNGTVSVHHFDFDPAEYESSIDSDAFSDDVTDSDSEVDEAMDAYIKSLLEKGIRFSRRLVEFLWDQLRHNYYVTCVSKPETDTDDSDSDDDVYENLGLFYSLNKSNWPKITTVTQILLTSLAPSSHWVWAYSYWILNKERRRQRCDIWVPEIIAWVTAIDP